MQGQHWRETYAKSGNIVEKIQTSSFADIAEQTLLIDRLYRLVKLAAPVGRLGDALSIDSRQFLSFKATCCM